MLGMALRAFQLANFTSAFMGGGSSAARRRRRDNLAMAVERYRSGFRDVTWRQIFRPARRRSTSQSGRRNAPLCCLLTADYASLTRPTG
jgi:hypothetical protein